MNEKLISFELVSEKISNKTTQQNSLFSKHVSMTILAFLAHFLTRDILDLPNFRAMQQMSEINANLKVKNNTRKGRESLLWYKYVKL